MQFLVFLMLFSRAYTQHFIHCDGGQEEFTCNENKDIGHADVEGCSRNANPEMYYFASGNCNKMKYLGCGGNRNRFCSKFDCTLLCKRNYKEDEDEMDYNNE